MVQAPAPSALSVSAGVGDRDAPCTASRQLLRVGLYVVNSLATQGGGVATHRLVSAVSKPSSEGSVPVKWRRLRCLCARGVAWRKSSWAWGVITTERSDAGWPVVLTESCSSQDG